MRNKFKPDPSKRRDMYQEVTNKVIALLEQGVVPWEKPWHTTGGGRPTNFFTGKGYRGMNIWLLLMTPYECPYWIGFEQAKKMGGHVRRGEKGTGIVKWNVKNYEKEVEDPDTGELKTVKGRYMYPMARTVFNLEQVEGIDWENPVKGSDFNPITEAHNVVVNMPTAPNITHGGDRACYQPSSDTVNMPKPETFRSREEYYSTMFHELTHSTGHRSRLHRKGMDGDDGEWTYFGSKPYAHEELVAELGASFLCGEAGIVQRTVDNSAGYIDHWLKTFKSDKRILLIASGQAAKAADYILGITYEDAAND